MLFNDLASDIQYCFSLCFIVFLDALMFVSIFIKDVNLNMPKFKRSGF